MSFNLKFAPLALAGLLATAAMPAFAADAIESAPAPMEPAYEESTGNWTGGYAGANLGYGFNGKADSSAGDVDTDGIVTGVFAGYNHELGNSVVVGAEAEGGYSNVRGSEGGIKAKSGLEGSLRGRLGYAATSNVMPYATGGVAVKKAKVSEGGVGEDKAIVGWTAGAGVDVKMTENVFVRGEYRYSDYGRDDFTTASGPHDVKTSDHRTTVGVGYKF